MNSAHLHLLFNHLPILGTLFGILILLGGYLLRSAAVKRTALGIFVLSAGFALVAFQTGEGAEEAVEGLSGVSEALISRHEELADLFLGASIITGVIALFNFLGDVLSWRIFRTLYVFTLVAAAGTMVLAQQVGTSGGEIRHSEIRTAEAQIQGVQDQAELGGRQAQGEEEED